jgi:hypothetical protein
MKNLRDLRNTMTHENKEMDERSIFGEHFNQTSARNENSFHVTIMQFIL